MKFPGTHNGSLRRERERGVAPATRGGARKEREGCGYIVPTSVSECAKWFVVL